MTDHDTDNKTAAAKLKAGTNVLPDDRASESVVSPDKELGADWMAPPAGTTRQTSAISSGPFDIRASLPPEVPDVPESLPPPPPSAVTQNALDRGQAVLPLSKLVGIACAIFVVVVGLTLLLFR